MFCCFDLVYVVGVVGFVCDVVVVWIDEVDEFGCFVVE